MAKHTVQKGEKTAEVDGEIMDLRNKKEEMEGRVKAEAWKVNNLKTEVDKRERILALVADERPPKTLGREDVAVETVEAVDSVEAPLLGKFVKKYPALKK